MRNQGRHRPFLACAAALGAAVFTWPNSAGAQPPPPPPPPITQQVLEDITNTKHNLSSADPQQLLSSGVLPRPGTARDAESAPGGTSEICVFCHTPHGASATGGAFKAPIWNRTRRDSRAERASLLPLEMNACLPGCVWNATPRSLSPLERNIGFWTQA